MIKYLIALLGLCFIANTAHAVGTICVINPDGHKAVLTVFSEGSGTKDTYVFVRHKGAYSHNGAKFHPVFAVSLADLLKSGRMQGLCKE